MVFYLPTKMCDIKVCRICLRYDSKFYRFDEFYLKNHYEEVMSLPVSIKDGLPHYFCYECAALLHKYHNFREKCYYGQKLLQEMLWLGPITYTAICKFNLEEHTPLKQGQLDILNISKKVKTYNIQHSLGVLNEEADDKEDLSSDFSDVLVSNDENDMNPMEKEPQIIDVLDINNDVTNFETAEFDNNESDVPDLNMESDDDLPLKPSLKKSKRTLRKRNKIIEEDVFTDDIADIKNEDIKASDLKKNVRKTRKKASVMSPDTKKYKFSNSKDSKLKVLAFLDSGFWKKSSLTEEEALNEFLSRGQNKKYLNAAYKCTDCYRGFSQKSMLERHIPQRHGEAAGSLVCRFCKMRFKSAYFLNKHMRQHFTKYECLRCNLVCNLENSALFHEEYHSGVIRTCIHCAKEFRHLSTFYTHLRTHRSKHMCSWCGESFVSQLGLRLHKKAKHPNEPEQQETAVAESTYCQVCQIKFETPEAYDRHLLHSAMHSDENKILDERAINDTIDVRGGPENYEDNKTEELLKRKSRVENTLSAVRKSIPKRPTSKKPTTCHQCGQHFDTQTACMKHHVAEHPGTSFFSPTERIICEICGASLAPGSVPAHLNQHTRSKMYTCVTCGRSFTTSTMLRNHLVTHTGEKRFACSLCDKRFTQNGSLSLHYRTFHLKQPYPKRNRRKKVDAPTADEEEF